MSACGSLCRSRTGPRLSCEGHLIERKERVAENHRERERENRYRWKSREDPKGREGVAAAVKETHTWSLKDGKEGKEEMLQERNRGGKNGSNYSGVIGMEWGGKFQRKRLENRGRSRWRRMRAGWRTNWPLNAHVGAIFQEHKEGVGKGCVKSKSDVDSTGRKAGLRWERAVLWIRH